MATIKKQFKIEWIDGMRFPQCLPDLRYPEGVDLDVAKGREPICIVKLPYPAKRCGWYSIECTRCGCNAVVTTAGRIDDPRSIRLPCGKPGKTEMHVAPHAQK
jgi:hypothetical protein